ncbi:MAG: CotH kinase family protein, partial [archaeon]|nr:CotH kinase family protein [archaeon]
MLKYLTILFLINLSLFTCADKKEKEAVLLEGTPISSDADSKTLKNAFSNDYTKEFKSTLASNGWVGIELEKAQRITKIGWAQKKGDKKNYLLGVFEGSNDEAFIDAIPLFMITEEGKAEKMNYAEIKVNYAFKYLRYVGPNNSSCVISGLEFYGYESSTKLEEGEEELYQPTKLPLVVIHTEGAVEPTEKEIGVNFRMAIISGGKRDTKTKGVLKLRGNSTMTRPKSPYKMKLEEKTNILDFPAKAKKWNLLSNFYDKTLVRNDLAFKISSLLEMKYTPVCKFVDVMVNGEYKGTYQLCDNVEVGKNRVNLSKMDETCVEEPEITGGYMIEACGHSQWQGDTTYQSDKGIVYIIRYPKEKDITKEQINYITKKVSEIEEEVYSGKYDNIDLDSLMKYTLVQELGVNMDFLWSTYMTKEREDNKLYFGPLWDFDLAFGNDVRSRPLDDKNNFIFKYSGSSGTMKQFYTLLFNNKKLLDKVKKYWVEITKTKSILTKDILIDYIDEQLKYIKDSRELNFIRWDMMTKTINFFAEDLCTYDEQTEFLKSMVIGRFNQLGEIIANATVDSVNEEIPETGGWGGFGGNGNGTWPSFDWGNITWGGDGEGGFPWGGNGTQGG